MAELKDEYDNLMHDHALTKRQLMEARGLLWHSITVCVVISQARESFHEAQCSCGWSSMHGTYPEARRAGDDHIQETKSGR